MASRQGSSKKKTPRKKEARDRNSTYSCHRLKGGVVLWWILTACVCYAVVWIVTFAFHVHIVVDHGQLIIQLIQNDTSIAAGSEDSYLTHFGTPVDVAKRSFMRRQQHEQLANKHPTRRHPQSAHINFLDKEFHPLGDKRDHIIHSRDGGLYRIGRGGMLQKLSSKKTTTQNSTIRDSYAPTGGALPVLERGVFSGDSYQRLGEWPEVDQFQCLRKNTSDPQSDPYFEWQKRAPYVIILGAMKGGTQALTTHLWQHERFVKQDVSMELHFFGHLDYQQSPRGIPIGSNQKAYAYRFQKSHSGLFDPHTRPPRTSAKPHVLAIDSTPYYLLMSDVVPQAICCVAPWAKLVALLRDPVDRILSHYRYLHESRWRSGKAMVDWDAWIHADLQLLRETGVWQDWTKVDFDTFSGSVQEFQAWKRYVHHEQNVQYVVGRGMYAIQLEHYYKVWAACPRMQQYSPDSPPLKAVKSEEFARNTNRVYNEILKFLQLDPVNLTDTKAKHETMKLSSEIPMPAHIRQELQAFYRPYNQRLYKLLNWTASMQWPLTPQDDFKSQEKL